MSVIWGALGGAIGESGMRRLNIAGIRIGIVVHGASSFHPMLIASSQAHT